MRGSTFSCPTTFTPAPDTMPGVHRKSIRGFANVSLPPTWSSSTCVLTMYSMRPGEIFWISARTAAVISCRAGIHEQHAFAGAGAGRLARRWPAP